MNRNEINIAMILDDNYVIPTVVSITSLHINVDKKTKYNIYLFLCNVNKKNKKIIKEINSPANITIKTIDVLDNLLNERFVIEGFSVSVSATIKFYLPILLPNLDKVLYIDGDTIIKKDLMSLYCEDIKDYYAGVVKDYYALFYGGDVWKRLGTKNVAYFNSGVMLLNLKKMRNDDITNKLVNYRLNVEDFYMDQDTFNIIIGKKVKYLDFSYNMQTVNYRKMNTKEIADYYSLPLYDEKEEYINRSSIIHFDGKEKPWIYYDILLADLWFNYYIKSSLFSKHKLIREKLEKKISNKGPVGLLSHNSNYIQEQEINRKPYVSIIVSIFNIEHYIRRAIESAINQTLRNIEIVIIYDSSIGTIPSIIKEYSKKDKRINVIDQKNQFLSVARNRALKTAKGEYIIFLDGYDILPRNAAETYYIAGLTENSEILISGAYEMNKNVINYKNELHIDRRFIPKNNEIKKDDYRDYVLNITSGSIEGKCFKTSFCHEHNLKFLKMPKYEDFYFVDNALALAQKITVLDDCLYYCETNKPNEIIYETSTENPFILLDAIELCKDRMNENGVFKKVKRSFENKNIQRLFYMLRDLENKDLFDEAKEKVKKICVNEYCFGLFPDSYFYYTEEYGYLCDLYNIKYKKPNTEIEKERFFLELYNIKNSKIYKAIMLITYAPRKIKGIIKSVSDNGIVYTLRRVLYHLHLAKDNDINRTITVENQKKEQKLFDKNQKNNRMNYL